METVKRKLAEIFPYENNAKEHSDRQIDAVAESIRQFGIVQPIVVDKNGVIIIGHCRYEAAKRLGLEDFPCVVADLTEAQAKALRLIDNRTNESDWEMDVLRGELNDIFNDFELTDLGFTEADLLEIRNDIVPDSLKLEDADIYADNAEEQLVATKVIFNYKTADEKRYITEKLGITKDGVVHYVKNLMEEI